MKEKHFRKWEKLRRKGKKNFILVNGLLYWGFPMFIVMTFTVNKPASGNIPLGLIGISAVIWTLGGLAFGHFTWGASERAFQKELQNRKNA